MVEQGYLTPRSSRRRSTRSLPTRKDIRPPLEDTAYPYFTSWVKQQVVDKLGGGQEGARKAFEGGLTVQTTLDVRLQEAAQQAVDAWLPYEERPARVARRDRQPHRRGARDGRRRRLLHPPVQPRHPGPAPARLGVQAVRARPGAHRRHLPGLDLGVAARCRTASRAARRATAPRRSRSTTTRTPTPASAPCAPRRRTPTTRSTRSSASRSGRARSPGSRAGWASARRSRTTSR